MTNSSEHAAGQAALNRLVAVCLRFQESGTWPIAAFLVSLHNPRLAKPDAYRLCRFIEDEHFEDVMTVMRFFRNAPGNADLQDLLEDGVALIQRIIKDYDYTPASR